MSWFGGMGWYNVIVCGGGVSLRSLLEVGKFIWPWFLNQLLPYAYKVAADKEVHKYQQQLGFA